jgi:hypothetical protein
MDSKFKGNGIINVKTKPIGHSIGRNNNISGNLLPEFSTLKMEPNGHYNIKSYNITKYRTQILI